MSRKQLYRKTIHHNTAKATFLLVIFALLLSSCIETKSQYFIFGRRNLEDYSWLYYKTDLYHPEKIEALDIPPCYEDEPRVIPYWSPNGEFYVCQPAADQPLRIYDKKGNLFTEIVDSDSGFRWVFDDWSPDSQQISMGGYVDQSRHEQQGAIIKRDGSDLIQLLKQAGASVYGGTWSPNGNFIVEQTLEYGASSGLLFIYLSTGEKYTSLDLNKITHDTREIPVVANEITWSPDSTKIAFITGYNTSMVCKLHIWDIETGQISDIVADNATWVWHILDWSPDGQKILFTAFDNNAHVTGNYSDTIVYSINIDGTNLQSINVKDFLGPYRWTPNGESLLFYQQVFKQNINRYLTNIYLMDADGKNKRLLIENASFVSWITP